MLKNNILKVDNTCKTKTWWIFLFVLLFIVIPFTIVWLLVGEFNVLKKNWLIAMNASVWHGIVQQDNIDFLANKYQIFYQGGQETLKNQLINCIGKNISIDSAYCFFNNLLLLILGGLILLVIFLPILFNKLKINGIDVLPFSCLFGFLMTSIILTGLIPYWSRNMISLYWVVRILIALSIAIIIFLITNTITNKWIANSNYAMSFLFGYKKQYELNKITKQQLQKTISFYKKQNDDKSYIDIESNE